MIVTRKIEVVMCEDDQELRKSHYKKLYANKDIAVKVANMGVSHLFALDNTMPYLSAEDKEKITFLGVKGNPATKQNAPYVAASEAFKGQVDMNMVANLLQNVRKMYSDDMKKGMWNRSLRSYKENMPIPYQAYQFYNMRFADYEYYDAEKKEKVKSNGCFFTLMGVPFKMRFGRDRSGNRLIVERVLNGEYKMCTSSIAFEKKTDRMTGKKKQKIFLLLCVDMQTKEVKVDPKKTMYAFLGVMNPVVCTCDVRAAREYDSGMMVWEIGTKEEFNYRRRQIQEAVKRLQIDNRYNEGGKGRKRKCKSIDRWHEKEHNYIDTKLHTYSRKLVDLAIKHGCGTIHLLRQEPREKKAKDELERGEPFVIRNWGYFGFKDKIAYKCKLAGITLKQDKEDNEE